MATEVELVWGEPGCGSRKTTVSPREQVSVRAVVSPVPDPRAARGQYKAGWRTAETATA